MAKMSMVVAAGCWGSATTMSKAILEQVPPLSLLILQLLASTTFLWAAVLLSGIRVKLSWNIFATALLGILEPGIAYLLMLYGLEGSSASTASLVATSEPLMVLGLGALLLREKPSLSLLAWGVLGILGVVVALGTSAPAAPWSFGKDDFLLVAGTLSAALYVIASPFGLKGQSPLVVAALQQTAGLIFIVCLSHLEIFASHRGEIVSAAVIPALLSGVVQYALAFWTYLIALKSLPVSSASMYLNLIPVFGMGSGYFFLGEELLPLQLVGAGLIGLSVFGSARVALFDTSRDS